MTTTAELTGPAATTTARRNARTPGGWKEPRVSSKARKGQHATVFRAPDTRTASQATLDTPGCPSDEKRKQAAVFCLANGDPQLEPNRRAAIDRRAKDMPRSFRKAYLRAATGGAWPRQAIRMFCLECVCYDRREVALCTSLACPLWLYRFGKRPGQAASPAEAAGEHPADG